MAFTPSPSPSSVSFTADGITTGSISQTINGWHRLRYGDHPILNGTLAYGQLTYNRITLGLSAAIPSGAFTPHP